MSSINVLGFGEWEERSTPLPKDLVYVFSWDLEFFVQAVQRTASGGATVVAGVTPKVYFEADARTVPAKGTGFTYHVRDEVLIRSADGVVRNVPHANVHYAHDRVDVGGSGAGTLSGRALLNVDEGGTVSMEYTGVVTMVGDVAAVLSDARAGGEVSLGSAFISIRSASERAKYRWLMENQLFGFGRVSGLRSPTKGSEERDGAAVRDGSRARGPATGPHLRFTYDVYLAG